MTEARTPVETRVESLAKELDSAFRNRADLYRLFLDELTADLGPEHAEAMMIRAIEKRGREVAALAFANFGPNDARKIGEAFLAVSPDGGRMYPTDVERGEHHIAFKVKRCPLKDAWVDAGVGDEKLATLAASRAHLIAACSRQPASNSKTSPGRRVTAPAAAT